MSAGSRLNHSRLYIFFIILNCIDDELLCHQVYSEALSLLEFCRVQLKVVQLTASMPLTEMVRRLDLKKNYISALILQWKLETSN